MKVWIKILFSIFIGIVFGILLPKDLEWIKYTLNLLSELSVNAILYFSLLYVAVKTYLGIIHLKKENKRMIVLLYFFICVILSLFIAIIVTMGIMNIELFQPDSSLPIPQAKAFEPEQYSFDIVLKNIISDNFFAIFQGKFRFILPVYLISFIFGFATLNSDKKSLYFVEVAESFEKILDVIIRQLLEFYFIGSIIIVTFLTFDNFYIFEVNNISLFLKSLLAISIATIILLIFFSLLIVIFTKRDLKKCYSSIIGAGLIGFVTGNTAATIIPLTEHLNKNYGVADGVAKWLTPLGIIVNRTGTIIVSIIVIFSSILLYSSNNLSLALQLNLFLLLFIFSFRLDGMNEAGFFILVSLILKISSLHLEENSYLLFLVFVPLLSRIAVFIDVMTTGLFVIISAHFTQSIDEIDNKEQF
ncbi:MAG: dicarboxylate/amino acid:cation symporter [Spirochaetes bacterium]|nr:dicarboxylate/amino acid:cation symporter [Spirochaetota bacterium]